MKRPLLYRATALLLSWVFTATTVWAGAPPAVSRSQQAPAVPLPRLFPWPEPASSGMDPLDKDPLDKDPLEDRDKKHHDRGNDGVRDHDDDDDDDNAVLRPIVGCVGDNGNGRFTAFFTYRNKTDHEITIPVGAKNRFSPPPEDRGQPTRFKTGSARDDPSRVFGVPFDGRELTWTLRGPDGERRSATASAHSRRCPAPPPSCDATIFGPHRFTRTAGPPNVYTETVHVPSWITPPYVMKVVNGDADGRNRVSSARIEINGKRVAGPEDFGQRVPGFARTVDLTPRSTLEVKLEGKPGSFLAISLCGQGQDKTPPQVMWAEPAPGSTIKDPTPRMTVRYEDVKGPDDAGASGVDVAALRVSLDDVDRTSLFTKFSNEATAELPEDLALSEGVHRLKARIKDKAGNLGEAVSEFRVDRTPPQIKIVEPPNGAFLGTASPTIRVQYQDDVALDLDSLRIFINGADRTALFQKGAGEAVATIDPSSGLKEGANQVDARIKDLAGNEATHSIGFNVDLKPPTVVIGQPVTGSRLGSSDVEIVIQYRDDQGLDLGSFEASVDGNRVSLGQGPEGAMGRVVLSEGSHTLRARIKDRAGNEGTASSTFTVDTTAPELKVLQPPPGFIIKNPTPQVVIAYGDSQGVDTATLVVTINGADQTALFEKGPDGATAKLTAPLPEGSNTIEAEIKDVTGNRAVASSTFTVDTVAPTGLIESPGAYANAAAPAVKVSYTDQGSGVDPATVKILVDGQDRTALFSVGAAEATGVLQLDPPLAEGSHEIRVLLADRAGNEAEIGGAFVLDTTPPGLTLERPSPDSFIADATPDLLLTYDDGAGSGVDLASLRLFLRKGDDPETEITSLLAIRDGEAAGVIPDGAALTDGPYTLRAALQDRAGNASPVEGKFELDTVPPTFVVDLPAAGAFIPKTTPAFLVRYADDRSGVDVGLFELLIDGTDYADRLTREADKASGVLPPADAFAQGPHQLEVKVFDRAGNQAAGAPQTFTVDSVPPTVVVDVPPAGSFLGTAQPLFRFLYDDANGSGIDPALAGAIKIEIDGTDRTAAFALGATKTEGTLPTPLADGPHTARVDVADQAGNTGTAMSVFSTDTQPPAVNNISLEEGAYIGRVGPDGRIQITGTIQDLDPSVTLECRVGNERSPGAVGDGGFTCSVPLTEGPNSVEIIASDRNGNQTTVPRNVTLDTIKPKVSILEPADGDYTNAFAIMVRGRVEDATPVKVEVEGVAASVSGTSFTALNVPVGDPPQVTLQALATDAAGNQATASVTLNVDRVPPVIRITSPQLGAYVRGALLDVEGTVEDTSPVLVYVNTIPASVTGNTFKITIPVLGDGPFTIEALALDAANNAATDTVQVNVDSVPPTIVVNEPAPGLVTNAARLLITGTVTDDSPVSLRIDGTPVPVQNGAFAHEATLRFTDGEQTFTLAAKDLAGNESTAPVTVIVDRTPPELEVLSPPSVVGGVPVIVQGTVKDLTETTVTVDGVVADRIVEVWQASFATLPDNPHTFKIVATDAATNQTKVDRQVTVDLQAPTVTINSPADGFLTREAAVDVTGSASALSGITSVTVNGRPATVTGTTYTALGVPLAEGDNSIVAMATSGSGRTAQASIVVTRDTIPPVIELVAPDRMSRGQAAQAVATVTDNIGVAEVVIKVGGAVAGTFTTPPFAVDLTVPPGVANGQTFEVRAEAVDKAGNPASPVFRSVLVTGETGVIVGQVLSDGTGLPLAQARVRLVSGAGGETTTTDERGRYTFRTGDPQAVLVADKDGMTAVERGVATQSERGTVPVDARLTPLAALVKVGPTGGVLTAGPVTIAIAPSVLGAEADFRLTSLSPQGAPGLLPLGWSPTALFDYQAGTTVAATLTVGGQSGLPAVELVQYRPSVHEWFMVAPGLTPAADGTVTTAITESGSYALVVPDVTDPPIPIPAPGDMLKGVAVVALPADATSTGVVEPAILPPSGGTAKGTLAVSSAVPLPSGTIVQAEVKETFTLASGAVASEELRTQDIVLFRIPAPDGAALAATIPITPSRTFQTTDLVEGKVHLDILAGREGVRGRTVGNEAARLESGDAALVVAANALSRDTAITFDQTVLSSFLPSGPGLVPLSEMVVDFSGETLALGAELSVASPGGGSPGDTLLVAKVERIDGIPRLVVVALAEIDAQDRIVSKPRPGLLGITRGGRYVFYRVAGPIGFVSGRTLAGSDPVAAIVETAGLPFIALSDLGQGYTIPALPGSAAALTARVRNTSLLASVTVVVTAAQTTIKDITLEGVVTTATVTPEDGAVAVEPSAKILIETSAALNPATISAGGVKLFKGPVADNQLVAFRLLAAGSGKLLTIVPQETAEFGLSFSTTYTLQVSGLADVFGGLVVVPLVTFRTKDDVPPVYNTDQLRFSLPDNDGIITIEAPPGTFPPGTTILIVNSGNGTVLSLTAGNDGEVAPAQMAATIDDRMLVTITDPLGNVTSFERTKFVAPDGTTAVGVNGGTIEGPGGVELRIPEGALDKAVKLKLEPFTPAPTDPLPDVGTDAQGKPLANFGAGLKIESKSGEPIPTLKKEAGLAFPVPEGLPPKPEDAFFYVYRRIEMPNGKVAFETIDQAFLEGEAGKQKVVTASFPFSGFATGYGLMTFSPAGSFAIGAVTTSIAFLMWSVDQLLPGKPLPGAITGRVLRTVFTDKVAEPTYEPIIGAVVSGVDVQGIPLLTAGKDPTMAISQAPGGTYTLWDTMYTGGTVRVTAVLEGGNPNAPCPETLRTEDTVRCATAYEANPQDWKSTGLRFYRNIATANIIFPPIAPPPPPPEVDLQILRLVEEGQPPRKVRKSTDGIVLSGATLVIGFRTSNPEIEINTATITGPGFPPTDFTVMRDPARDAQPPEPYPLDFRLQEDFKPVALGTYTVKATAIPALGQPFEVASTFRVVGEGGAIRTLQLDPPKVVPGRTIPKDKSKGNPVSTTPQVVFSEPVRNVPGNVELIANATLERVGVTLVGVGFDETTGDPKVYPDLSQAPDAAITSLTIQPSRGLEYGEKYRLVLKEGIEDLDTNAQGDPEPKSLEPYEMEFDTLQPGALTRPGEGEIFVSPGIAVLGNRAYLVQNNFFNGQLRVFNVTVPDNPVEIKSASQFVTWRPVDITAQEDTQLAGGRLVVVATTVTNRSVPSNLYLFDVSSDEQTTLIGYGSLTNSAIDGTISRIALRGRYAYSATGRKGIQVVDLQRVKQAFEEQGGDTPLNRMALNLDGRGFTLDAVVQTIPLFRPAPPGQTQRDRYALLDVDVADFIVDSRSQPLVAATGHLPLAVANPQTGEVLYQGPVELPDPQLPGDPPAGRLSFGFVVTLARLASRDPTVGPAPRDYALLGGTGTVAGENASVLAVVDLSDPRAPKPLRVIKLKGFPEEILIKDDLALIGEGSQIEIVSLAIPADPLSVGVIREAGGRLALGEDGTIFSTFYGRIGGPGVTNDLGGVRAASLEKTCTLLSLRTPRVVLPQILKDKAQAPAPPPSPEPPPTNVVPVVFSLCRDSQVTLSVEGKDKVEARIDDPDAPKSEITDQLLTAGIHKLYVATDLLGEGFDVWKPFVLKAVDVEDTTNVVQAKGRFTNDLANRRVVDPGQTFVKGVNLSDGHLVRSFTDLMLPGRNLHLEITRTYASSGLADANPMGAGWNWTYDSTALRYKPAGKEEFDYIIKAADGTSTRFESKDETNFTPEKGYHTRLESEKDAEGRVITLNFFDKANNTYHFIDPRDVKLKAGRATLWKLKSIRDPHGDEIQLEYDSLERVSEVRDVASGVRLSIEYIVVADAHRIAKISDRSGLNISLTYEYDGKGNLIRAWRTGVNVGAGPAGPARIWGYSYSANDEDDPHRLTSLTDPDFNRVEYVYGDPKNFTHEDAGVTEIREDAKQSGVVVTQFDYQIADPQATSAQTTVTDGRGNATVYLMDDNATLRRVDEPLGKFTEFEWNEDKLKTKETDSLGRVTQYGYDEKGNLALERISKGGLVSETTYVYDQTFSKLKETTDAEKRKTVYGIDGVGNVFSVADPLNTTTYGYDGAGRLVSVTNARSKVTTHSAHNNFGQPQQTRLPGGQTIARKFDGRGRLFEESDSFGRRAQYALDGLDRVVEARRLAGATGSEDEVTTTEYTAAGQVRAVTNANRARTFFTLDGLNRVTGTQTTFAATTITTSASYDPNGNKIAETDARGVQRQYTYDALNRLELVSILGGPSGGPAGPILKFEYDTVGNRTAEVNLLSGVRTEYVYDGLYRVKEKTLIEPSTSTKYVEKYGYDAVGNRKLFVDMNGASTTYSYDGLNRMTQALNAANHIVSIKYDDPEGSHLNKSEELYIPQGLRAEYTYDALNRETIRTVKLEGPGSSGEKYATITTYLDPTHSMRVFDPNAQATETTLDGLDRVVKQVVDPGGLNLETLSTYDGLGSRTSITDPRNNKTEFDYDGLGRLESVTDAQQKKVTYTYFADGLRKSETDRRNVTRNFEYDNLGRIRKVTLIPTISFKGWSQETRYDDFARTRTEVDARGTPTVYGLDALDRVVKETDLFDKSIVRKYVGLEMREETDKRNNTRTFEYDVLHRLKKVTDPAPFDNQSVMIEYLDGQNQQIETDRRGTQAVTQFDPLGRVVSVTRDGVLLETNLYDGNDNRLKVTDGEGRATAFQYDAADRVKIRTDGEGSSEASKTTFVYDGNGNVEQEFNERVAQPIVRTYDELNRLTSVTNRAGETTVFGYDEEGNRTLMKEPEGQETTYEYGELGELLKVTQPPAEGGTPVFNYEYDENRNQVRQTDAEGRVVLMGYDELNRQTSMTQDPDGFNLITLHGYDPNGNEELLTDPKGQKVTAAYDALNRVSAKGYVFASGDTVRPWRHTESITYAYDKNSNLTRVEESVASGTDPPGPVQILATVRTYDRLDRLTSEQTTLPDGNTLPDAGLRTVGYQYLRNGTRQSVTDPQGLTTSYAYDGKNRLSSVTTAGGTTSYLYFPDDLLQEVRHPNGVKATYSYDAADRVLSIRNERGAQLVSAFTYTYDKNGNRKTQVEQHAGLPLETTSYDYDALNRLANVAYPPDAEYNGGRTVAYKYDKAGNRGEEQTSAVASGPSFTRSGSFDPVNRLRSLTHGGDPGLSVEFGYDRNGNQISRTLGPSTPTPKVTRYRYDVRDMLAEVLEESTVTAQFQYDFEGRRNTKIGLEGPRQYVNDDTSLFLEYNRFGEPIAKYDWGNSLVSFARTGAEEPRRYFSFDALGSVADLTDDDGAPTARYRLDAWGNYRFPSDLSASNNRFGFTGYFFDPEASFYNAKARYFDPALGRFLSQDSFLGLEQVPASLHRYTYAHNQPTVYTDPSGNIIPAVIAAEIARRAAGGAVGAGIGAVGAFVLDLARQEFEKLDDTREAIDWQRAKDSAKVGAVIGAALGAAPELIPAAGVAGAGIGLSSASVEYTQGNYWTGSFDAVTSVLPFFSAKYRAGLSGQIRSARSRLTVPRPQREPTAPAPVTLNEGRQGANIPEPNVVAPEQLVLPFEEPLALRPTPQELPAVAGGSPGVAAVEGQLSLFRSALNRVPLPGESGFIGPVLPSKPAFPAPQAATRWSWPGHRGAALAEEQLAKAVHASGDEVVVRWGDPIGAHGADVISVNIRTGRVTMWDSKFRSSPRSISPTPTFTPGSSRLSNAVQEAIATIRADRSLPPGTRDAALRNLLAGRFNTRTVGAGAARNSTLR